MTYISKKQEAIYKLVQSSYDDLTKTFNKFDEQTNQDAIDNLIYALEELQKTFLCSTIQEWEVAE